MTKAWYIDTLDASSGYAFASYRMADLQSCPESGTATLGSSDTFFIEAPHFMAERVSSRAIAFGAARGRFQIGLYQGGAEVSFSTLGAVSEFVRRAYGSGGGSDDGGGGTPGSPGPPGEPPFDRSMLFDLRDNDNERGYRAHESENTDPVQSLVGAFRDLEAKIHTLSQSQASDEAITFYTLAIPSKPYGKESARRLARAALRLILEAVWLPDLEDPDGRWAINVSRRRLYECISRMAIWIHLYELLIEDNRANELAANTVKKLFKNTDFEDFFEDSTTAETAAGIVHLLGMWLCFGNNNSWTERYAFRRFRYLRQRYMGHFDDMPIVDVSLDRFLDISHIVIPAELIPTDCHPRRAAPTLRNLIAFACNSPAKIDAQYREALCETLLFGACYLNAPLGLNSRNSNNWLYGLPRPPFDIERELLDTNRMVAASMSWLTANLPRYVFNEDLEKIIANTASLRK